MQFFVPLSTSRSASDTPPRVCSPIALAPSSSVFTFARHEIDAAIAPKPSIWYSRFDTLSARASTSCVRFVFRLQVLVFINTKKNADMLGRQLEQAGFSAVVLHGGKTQASIYASSPLSLKPLVISVRPSSRPTFCGGPVSNDFPCLAFCMAPCPPGRLHVFLFVAHRFLALSRKEEKCPANGLCVFF